MAGEAWERLKRKFDYRKLYIYINTFQEQENLQEYE